MVKKGLAKNLVVITLLMIMFFQVVNATYFSGGRESAIFSAWYDNSVTQYGYTGILDEARANWDGITSKVEVSKTTTRSRETDLYFVGSTAIVGLYGQIQPYRRNFWGVYVEASLSETWDYSVLSIYDNQVKNFNLTRAQVVSGVATHEVGHTLSLAHSPSSVTMSVMKSGIISDYEPSTYDRSELKKKWGE